jgi:glycosyltransferase involved in cell wall biosynthesis
VVGRQAEQAALTQRTPRTNVSRPVKILQVIPWPVFGGPHNEALMIGSNAPRAAWTVIALLPPGADRAGTRFEEKGVAKVWLPMARLRRTAAPLFWLTYPFRLVADVYRLTRLIRRERIDVVEGSSVNIQAALAARIAGAACIWRLVDITVPAPLRRLVALVLPYLADEILVNGHATVDAYPGLHRSRVPVTVYYPMIDEAAFSPRAAQGATRGADLVGTVANINPDKGIDLFVEACGRLAYRADLSFVVVGAEHETHRAYAERAKERARELRIADRLAFVGEQSDVAGWMRRMDIFVISSRREGTTTTGIEAMATGLPIVATNVGAVHEVVEDGRTGFLVPPDDPQALAAQIAALLDDPERRMTIGLDARREYERRFSMAALLSARLAAYSRVLARRSKASTT